jgi:cysteine desulfurase
MTNATTDWVYLDNAASTPLSPTVAAAWPGWGAGGYANPSAGHAFGFALRQRLAALAEELLALLGIPAGEARVIWTSGGTEANNLALLGAGPRLAAGQELVTSATEHASVHAPLAVLAETRGLRLTTVPVCPAGQLVPAGLDAALGPATALVALHQVQNETGVVQDLPAVRAALDRRAPQARFHVDAVQGAGKLPLPWAAARLDSVALSAHKFHGPGSVGALVVRRGREPAPLLYGGGQQDGLRPGSLDAVASEALVAALREQVAAQAERAALAATLLTATRVGLAGLRDRQGRPLRVRLNSAAAGSPYILSFSLPGYQGAVLARALGARQVIVGTGSACAAETSKPSAVLTAMGLTRDEAFATLRVSFGAQNTADDVARFLVALQAVVRDY